MLLEPTSNGLFCQAGGFYVDPLRPVARAIITHVHGDHARSGSARYLATPESLAILRHRLGPEAFLQTLPYFSLHSKSPYFLGQGFLFI